MQSNNGYCMQDMQDTGNESKCQGEWRQYQESACQFCFLVTYSANQKSLRLTSSLSSFNPWWGVVIGVRPRVALSVTSNLGAVLNAIKSYWESGTEISWMAKRDFVLNSMSRMEISKLLNGEMSLCNSPWAHHAGHCSLHLGGSLVEGEGSANLWGRHFITNMCGNKGTNGASSRMNLDVF